MRFTVFRYTQVLDTFRQGGGIAYVHMSGERGPSSENVRLPATGAVRLFDDAKLGETEEKLRHARAKDCANDDGGPGPGSRATWREFETEDPTWREDPALGPPLLPNGLSYPKALPKTVKDAGPRAFVAKVYPELLSELDATTERVATGRGTLLDFERLGTVLGVRRRTRALDVQRAQSPPPRPGPSCSGRR